MLLSDTPEPRYPLCDIHESTKTTRDRFLDSLRHRHVLTTAQNIAESRLQQEPIPAPATHGAQRRLRRHRGQPDRNRRRAGHRPLRSHQPTAGGTHRNRHRTGYQPARPGPPSLQSLSGTSLRHGTGPSQKSRLAPTLPGTDPLRPLADRRPGCHPYGHRRLRRRPAGQHIGPAHRHDRHYRHGMPHQLAPRRHDTPTRPRRRCRCLAATQP